MSLRIRQESALNLTLEGSVGSFRVGTGSPGQTSLEVKYFLTHVGLNFSSGSNDALLSALAPVREIFEFSSLDFDEIMQRDIDDARVSSDLIPYLLDEKSVDLIKLFPPIVVFVLPVEEGRNKPAEKYPEVFVGKTVDETPGEPGKHVTRSGPVGREVFQFEQPISNGELISHDLVRFRLNTHRTRLVIVDGQHRAMALLAIYRNLKDQWSDERRAPFKEYYAEWTPNFIGRFNLTDINLPVILCTVPSLDTKYQGDFDLKKAARSVFLTLNKTARKVSNSRNILLNDNDLIASFLRRCLSEVKRKDSRSPYSFRIWNVELDQFGDKLKVQSSIANTGVSHVYYMIEHMLLDSGDVAGIAPRSGKFYKRTYLVDCLDRLDGRNVLGATAADSTRRDNFSRDAEEKLGRVFDEHYGQFIISTFETFGPFERHNRAVLNLESRIEKHQDRQLRPILFDGQGIGRVFETHRSNLNQRLRENYFRTDVPEIKESAKRLDASAIRVTEAIADLRSERASLYMTEVSDKSKIRVGEGAVHQQVVEWLNTLYDDVFATVAFQSAVVCGFFGEFEKAGRHPQLLDAQPLDRHTCFVEYVDQLNSFFIPKSVAQLKRMIRVFTGEVVGDAVGEWKVTPSNQTFRNVVYRGEMQPDQWPKYKYLLLETWDPSHPTLKAVVEEERTKCRGEVFSGLYNAYKTSYCREHRKLEDDLKKTELAQIFGQAFSAYSGLLKNLGTRSVLDKTAMKTAVSMVPAAAGAEPEPEHEDLQESIGSTDDAETS